MHCVHVALSLLGGQRLFPLQFKVFLPSWTRSYLCPRDPSKVLLRSLQRTGLATSVWSLASEPHACCPSGCISFRYAYLSSGPFYRCIGYPVSVSCHDTVIMFRASGSVTFAVNHYAGTVGYNATGWLQKNQSALPAEAVSLLMSSANEIMVQAVGLVNESSASQSTGKGKSKSTVGMSNSTQCSILAHWGVHQGASPLIQQRIG